MKPTDIIKTLVTLSAPFLMWGCSDDAFNHDTPLPGEQFEGIMLSIPNVVAPVEATRSDASVNEAAIKSLTILAYPQAVDGNGNATPDGNPTVVEYDSTTLPSDVNKDNNSVYKHIPVLLSKGDYHIYVIANVDAGDLSVNQSSWKDIAESDLRNANLTPMAPFSAADVAGGDFGGIPMSCNYTSLTKDGLSDTFKDGLVTISSGMQTNVYAPLTFAVSKVRVTLLNDFNASLKMATENPATLTNGAVSVKLTEPARLTDLSSDPQPLTDGSYFGLPENTDPEKAKVDELPALSGENVGEDGLPKSTWAWQGVWYIPERLYADGDDNKSAISLAFNNKSNNKALPLNELNRSTFYDYVGTSNGEFILKVYPWDIEQLVYTLHGPYYLHVWETTIPVKAGEITELQYESDTEINCISPMYTVNGKDIPLYEFAIKDNKISVSVNPKIPNSAFTDIMKESEDNHTYDFFHIRAGNLMKRIEVSPLDLREYLTLSRENITIDVREIIASGRYTDDFIIYMTTNVPYVRIDRGKEADWNLLSENLDERVLTIKRPFKKEDGTTLDERITSGEVFAVEPGVTALKVNFKELNGGDDFWKSRHTLTFTVYPITEDGKTQYDTDLVAPRKVTINIIPNIQNYTIHFKGKNWANPHIYVYQCLEFPANSQYPNVPVATDETGDNASLEYSFTGKVAFKGWNVGEYNDPDQPSLSTTKYNFRYFTDRTDDWNWLKNGTTGVDLTRHYNDNMDFCKDYRDNICDCSKCKGSSFERVWPGIKMQYEGNDWWKFELTGVATPGKALIMFSDQDVNHKNTAERRYPANNQVGIPLFDYPDKEGWFDVDAPEKAFTSQNPNTSTTVSSYRIYWPTSIDGQSYPYIWMRGVSVDYYIANAGTPTANGKWYYLNFIPKNGETQAEFLLKKTKDGNDKYLGNNYQYSQEGKNIFINLADFDQVGDRLVYTYENPSTKYPGNPDHDF